MENYGSAVEYAGISANSTGTANEKFENSLEGISAKLNTLTATFEEFSMSVLDSEWVVTGVEFLTSIVEHLNTVASVGDGIIVIFVGLVATVAILQSAFVAIKPKVIDFIAKLAGVSLAADGASFSLAIFGKALGNLFTSGALGAVTAPLRVVIAGIMGIGKACKSNITLVEGFDWALKTLNVNPLMAMYTTLAGVAIGTIAIIRKAQGERKRVAEAASEEYQAKLENAQAAKEEAQQLDELIDRYKELKSSGVSNSETREEIRNIQDEINSLVEDEKLKVDLVNNSLDENLKKLNAIKSAKAEDAAKSAGEAYYAARSKANNSFYNDIDDAGWVKFLREDRSAVIDEWDKEVAATLNKVDGIKASWDNNLLDNTLTAINIDANTAEEYVEVLNNALSALDENDQTDSKVYERLYSLREKYKEDLALVVQEAKALAEENIAEIAGSMTIDDTKIDTLEKYDALRESIIESALAEKAIAEAINAGDLSKDDVINAVDSYLDTHHSGLYDKVADTDKYTLKPIYEMIEEVEGGYDALYDALDDVNEQGIISADTLKAILDPENGYPALEKYLTRTTNGYILAEGALEDYVAMQKEAYVAALAAAEAGTEAWNIAYQNLEDLLLVLATKELERSTEATKAALEKKKEALEDTKKPLEDQKEALEDEIDALEKEKEALEKSKKPLEEKQEAYEEQLDRYEELIEVRKELLESYREELEYQKELEKKQRNVASLRTRLSVAKLDTSTAGQARVRELESELQEAEEDLNDFTLEHAIDVITTQLDSQLSQYESYIGAKVSEITAAIDGIDDAIEGVETEIDGVEESIDEIEGKLKDIDDAIDDVDDAISSAADGVKGTIGTVGGEIKALLDEYLKKQSEKDKEEEEKEKARKAVQDYVSTHNMTEGDKGRWVQDPNFKALYDTYVSLGGSINDIIGVSPKMMVQSYGEKTNSSDSNTTISQELFDKKKVVDEKGAAYMPYPHNDKDLWVKEGEGFSWEKVSNRYVSIKYTPNRPLYVKKYHAGGLVGNVATLKTSEEFAKLLQGEFVSTPVQMKNFMQKTLPQVASYNSSTGNEFKAPLINITCDNVTSETLPSLEKIVNNAVVEIKKQLDSGMSRAGFKPSAKKLLL